MKRFCYIHLGLVCMFLLMTNTLATAQESHDAKGLFIGKWHPIWSPMGEIPKACIDGYSDVRANNTITVVSGERQEVLTYSLVGSGPRYVLTTKFVSDNGKPNCQGFAPTDVQQGRNVTGYVEFNSSGTVSLVYSDSDGKNLQMIERKID